MQTPQVVIHHPKLKLESAVPASTAKNLEAKGWKSGPLVTTKKES